ncbi:carbohydrate ABC transporter membrane protein 1, CUT1 family (TC 3.A.1.1.-) [Gracilibacillus ureilyticus]|uniref:Carbohydrate ABC transporter membrane protein 1, CUT1 family (TC 3.A.1.1.-) n=1 Tax=Gracilibacillus ureilyticus TaxID=531814 RepID=A0A1H9PUL0_9BACI|nr:sugar ABC transporter permease [Gracilibacillus ureilyticus]SER51894.1 carbohydrate ABC transporter membrane protein 1, CUT1 family (TC 3.A.1.1.-) [Gracilibacillus ureilyticus]
MNQTNSGISKKVIHKKSLLTEKKKEAISGYLYISPFFILFAIFGLFPILFSFYLGFQKWNGLGEMEFVGFQNFKWILTDQVFWTSLANTLIMWVLGTIPQLLIGIILAYALNSALIKMKGLFRVSVFMPYVTSTVAVAIVFGVMFNSQEFGLFNVILSWFGVEAVSWSTSWWGVKIAISTMVFWRWVGYNTIIYLAGLQAIPNELYEAAQIDGATVRQKIQYITIPILRPIIILTVFTSTIGALQLFTEPLIFIGRTYREEGITVVLYLYREAFTNLSFGPASAAAIILFVIIIILSSINVWVANRLGR